MAAPEDQFLETLETKVAAAAQAVIAEPEVRAEMEQLVGWVQLQAPAAAVVVAAALMDLDQDQAPAAA